MLINSQMSYGGGFLTPACRHGARPLELTHLKRCSWAGSCQRDSFRLCLENDFIISERTGNELSLLFVCCLPYRWQRLEVQGEKEKGGGIKDHPVQYLDINQNDGR